MPFQPEPEPKSIHTSHCQVSQTGRSGALSSRYIYKANNEKLPHKVQHNPHLYFNAALFPGGWWGSGQFVGRQFLARDT